MGMTSTAMVCSHVQNGRLNTGKVKIGTIMMKDQFGKLQVLKEGQRIVTKEFGHLYWRTSVDVLVRAVGNHKYEVALEDMARV